MKKITKILTSLNRVTAVILCVALLLSVCVINVFADVEPPVGLQNGTFETDISGWKSTEAGENISAQAEWNSNGYLSLKAGDADKGIVSEPFKIAGLTATDKPVVIYDSSVVTGFKVVIENSKGYKQEYTANSSSNKFPKASTGFTTGVADVASTVEIGAANFAADATFTVSIIRTAQSSTSINFDNIKLYLRVGGWSLNTAQYATAEDRNTVYTSTLNPFHGTAEDGIVVNGGYSSNGAFTNTEGGNPFDFSNGLTYWMSNVKGSKASDYMVKQTDGSYLIKNAKVFNEPYLVSIPKDKTVKVFIEYKNAGTEDGKFLLYQKPFEGTLVKDLGTYGKEMTDFDTYKAEFTTSSDITQLSLSIRGNSSEQLYIKKILITVKNESDLYVDVTNSNGVYNADGTPNTSYDPNYYGTKKDGITTSATGVENGVKTLTPISSDVTLFDFNTNGLKYWGPGYNTTGKASDYASVSSGVLTVEPNEFKGVESVRYTLPASVQGKTLVAMYKYKNTGTSTGTLRMYSYKGSYSEVQRSNGDIEAGKSTSIYGKTPNLSLNQGETEISIFVISNGTASNISIEEIKLLTADADGKFTDINDPAKRYNADGTVYVPDAEDDRFSDVDPDGYGSERNGLAKDKITRQLTPVDGLKNGNFDEGFRYWGTYWNNSDATTYADLIVEEDGNICMKLTPDANDGSGGWRGPSTIAFYIDESKVKAGDNLSVLYDWKGDTQFMVQLMQQTKEGSYFAIGTAGPAVNPVVIAENDDWNTSWAYYASSVKEDDTDDGKYVFYIVVQPTGNVKIETFVDNLRIVKINGAAEGGVADVYDLDGNLITFETDDEEDGDEDDNNEGNDNDANGSGGTNSGSGDNNNNGSGNNTGSGTDDNNGSGSGSGVSGGGYYYQGGQVNLDTVDLTEAMEAIEKLNSGEAVEHIPLFDIASDTLNMNAYISVNALTDSEIELVKTMDQTKLSNYAAILRAIMGSMSTTPNMENATAFVKFGGNAANTLPLSFAGHINLDFPVTIRIQMAKDSLDASKTYYAYRCDQNTKVIDNLGQVHLEELDDNLYLSIITNEFADFFITTDELKAKTDSVATEDNNSNLNWLWILLGSIGGLLVIGAGVVAIIIIKKKKR